MRKETKIYLNDEDLKAFKRVGEIMDAFDSVEEFGFSTPTRFAFLALSVKENYDENGVFRIKDIEHGNISICDIKRIFRYESEDE